MHRQSLVFALAMLCFSSLLPACSTSNNDVGSRPHDGSMTGGASGSATGDTLGSGGATGAPFTGTGGGPSGTGGRPDSGGVSGTGGRLGSGGVLGTGGRPGSGGVLDTGGRPGSGGVPGTGGGTSGSTQSPDAGDGQACTYNGQTYPYGATWPSTDGCHECWCDGRPEAVCDAGPPCDGGVKVDLTCSYAGTSYPIGAIFPSTDGCNSCECLWRWYREVACTMNSCTGSPVDASAGADACVYNGKTYPLDSHFAAVDGCNSCHCRTDGQVTCTFNCAPDAGAPDGVERDGPAPVDLPWREGGPVTVDAAAVSACSECGFDELCVAYYDGLCTPMGSGCNQVSAATRESILVNHETCFQKPSGDEICGTRDGQHFWGCGAPSCGQDQETLVSDINCYGP